MANFYPNNTSYFKTYPDTNPDYDLIYRGVTELLSRPFMKDIIRISYDGVIVDEYQDCTLLQHRLVLMLAEIIPCRILGDPLQGIFTFGDKTLLLDWDVHVRLSFCPLPPLQFPHRWKKKNERLGEWLLHVREQLSSGVAIDLRDGPVDWVKQVPITKDGKQIKQVVGTCMSVANRSGTVVAIHPLNERPKSCHDLASKLSGRYQSIEESDAKELQKWAHKFDVAEGNERAVQLIKFASDCSTKISTKLGTLRKRFENDQEPNVSGLRKRKELALLLFEISKTNGFSKFWKALEVIKCSVPESIMYRRDLWYSMMDTLHLFDDNAGLTLKQTAWNARQRRKHIGRRDYDRIVSRTLLIKGLEYDHSILLEADKFDRNNLYVALTRASKSVTVISPEPILRPR